MIERTRVFLCVCLFAGCGPAVESDIDPSSTSDDSSTTTPTTIPTTTTSTTATPTTATSTTTTAASTDSSGSTTGTGSDETADTEPPNLDECDVWEQDCPAGYKCMPWANDGGGAWNASKCTPIDRDPDALGEPCTVTDSPLSGIDSCVLGTLCWDVGEDGFGTCRAQCLGDVNDPQCPSGTTCTGSGDGFLNLCVPLCNPLDPDSCSLQQGCYPIEAGFVCAPDASGRGGGAGEACEFTNGCGPGTFCGPHIDSFCEPGGGQCCLEYCDLEQPQCPALLECFSFYEKAEAPPGYENVGYCGESQE